MSWALFFGWSKSIPALEVLDKYLRNDLEASTMNNWNRLLAVLDQTLGFGRKQNSTVKKRWQAYDNKTNEHVVWLEYRVRVATDNAKAPLPAPAPSVRDSKERQKLAFIRQLYAQVKQLEAETRGQ